MPMLCQPPTSLRHHLTFALAAAACIVTAPAFATTLLPVDFGDMVGQSHTIVHGRVRDVRSQTTSGRRAIESVVTIDVLESIKGADSPVVVFRVPSGQVGRYRRVTVGAPEFAAGDEVVLFLAGRFPVIPMPYGLSQGVYRVERDGTGRRVVTPAIPGPERLVRGDPARRPVAVDVFTQQVRAIAGGRP